MKTRNIFIFLLGINFSYFHSIHSMESTGWWSSLMISLGLRSVATIPVTSEPTSNQLQQQTIDLPSHKNLWIDAELIKEITLLPCSEDQNNKIVVEGTKESLALFDYTSVHSTIHESGSFLWLGNTLKKPVSNNDAIRLKCFTTSLGVVTLTGDISLTMDAEQWKDKKMILRKLWTQDFSSATLVNVEQPELLTLNAADNSTIICSGNTADVLLVAIDNATITAPKLESSLVEAYATEDAAITTQVTNADFIAEAQANGTIMYLGNPRSIEKKGFGTVTQITS